MRMPNQSLPVNRGTGAAAVRSALTPSGEPACSLCKMACSKLSGIPQMLCNMACDHTVC